MPPVRMKVVDAQDGSPVSGAFVLFQADAHEGTFTGHGGRTALIFAAEAVTDEAGELQIAKQEFSPRPFFLNTMLHNPQMVIFKPGYVALTLTNYRRIIAELQDVTAWMYDGQTIKLKRATTDRETAETIGYAANFARQSVDGWSCSWKKVPRFLSAIHRAAAEWERKRASLTDGDPPRGGRVGAETRIADRRQSSLSDGGQPSGGYPDERCVLRADRLRLAEGVLRALSALNNSSLS